MRPSMAVEHPWVTRRLDDELPLTDFQQLELVGNNIEIEGKLRKAMNIMMVCGLSTFKKNEGRII